MTGLSCSVAEAVDKTIHMHSVTRSQPYVCSIFWNILLGGAVISSAPAVGEKALSQMLFVTEYEPENSLPWEYEPKDSLPLEYEPEDYLPLSMSLRTAP